MITAKEARKQTDEIIENMSTTNLKEIDLLIKAAIKNGESQIFIYEHISKTILDNLTDLGYKCYDISSQREGALYKIKW